MTATRLVEDRLALLYRQGKMTGGLYSSLGQEGTAVGTAAALAEGDLLVPVIRNLGSILARGVSTRTILLQYLAKAASPSRGRDGLLHVTAPELGVYAPSAMLGTTVPVLAGMLIGERQAGRTTVGMTYVGDGASSVGAVHEGLNFAAVQHLPLVLVVEFNRWAYSTPTEKQTLARSIADRAPGYGIAAGIVDGNDVVAVWEAARSAVSRARSGGGPTLLECRTYRLKGHAEHDPQAYVDPEVLKVWRARDPIGRHERFLDSSGLVSRERRAEIRLELERDLEEDLAFVEASPSPAPDSFLDGVYGDAETDALARRQVGQVPW